VLTSDLEGPIIVPHAAQKAEQRVGELQLTVMFTLTVVLEGVGQYDN